MRYQTTPTAEPVRQTSADSRAITETLEDELESALEVDLEVQSSFQSASGGKNNILISFTIEEGDTVPSNAADRFETVAVARDATVLSKVSAQGVAFVNFENLKIGGIEATGAFTLAADQRTVAVNLQY